MRKKDLKIFINLGKTVKSLREEKGLSLNELSEKSGINIRYLKTIEQGNATGVSIQKVICIAESLGLKPHYLLEIIQNL